MKNRRLGAEILALRDRDLVTRARLTSSRALFDGYASQMEAVHVAKARELAKIVDEHGWPGISTVGEEGAEAAWFIAQHAISCPALQRRFHDLLLHAVAERQAPMRHLAYLTDRIRFNEGRPQVFGTLHDWDERDELSPWPIEERAGVDGRRSAAGLPPLAETTARLRDEALREGERPAASYAERQARQAEWARRVGWLGSG